MEKARVYVTGPRNTRLVNRGRFNCASLRRTARALRRCGPLDMLSRMTDQPSDPMKWTAPRDVARRSELAQVREDIRKLAKNITPLSDNDDMDDEWPKTLRLLLERYNALVKKPE